MESLFCCPNCGRALTSQPHRLCCPAGHSFDRAKEGYVHLLPANRMHSKNPGDDREMVAARSRFLSAGHYSPLRAALTELVSDLTPEGGRVLDSGCGEGWYTEAAAAAVAARGGALAGVDIAKEAVRRAAKRVRGAEFAVASVYHLPLADGTLDLVLNCFSPMAREEFFRLLKPGGHLVYVVPAARHLWELKELLYDEPYLNREENVEYEGFELSSVKAVTHTMQLGHDALTDLFGMTPYCWKTPREGRERLQATESMSVTADFRIHIFRHN